ncbi:E3 ubiquitin-protein ligase listerin [Gracilariopsis chorda]|uniref:E3 ubiquitin-protein ligase listerin n=1 Tax=Gracilariopsis chorda TaxID=448386 RepID=A0A2V3IYK8_9FLOR|nr:E3 ubiquitin-protein ligase listerin [Gracilariopsis chorda]|eukprot:PXF46767.1 E3 ubiquitin-protein ligase listerin [Gracilariopsis chorda]
MGRKPGSRKASSSAAAANLTDTPTFTSFAAATAQALQGCSSTAPPVLEQNAWDTTALQLLKKLSKRDTTTKEKALTDLTEHLKTLPQDPGVGTAFVTAWGEAFRGAVQDPHPAVRTAALLLMSDTVLCFRRAVQHIFPSILPLWLSAQGDVNATVSSAAKSSLERVLPSDAHRTRAFSRYAEDLRKFCEEQISQVSSSDNFLVDAKRIIAVLKWLLFASNSASSISPLVDNEPHALLLFAKGRKKRKDSESAIRDVCELATYMLSFMKQSEELDHTRAKQFADIAVDAIRKSESSGWDLTLTLLRDGWSASFGENLSKLSKIVCEAVASPIPTGTQALLPLFESLPHKNSSGPFAEKVLNSMKEYLHPSAKKKKRLQITASYALSSLLTYVQTASYTHRVLATRWYAENNEDSSAFGSKVFHEHVVPTCRLFLSGVLPPIAKQINESVTVRRRTTASGSGKHLVEISQAFGKILRVIPSDEASEVISNITLGFASGLSEHSPDERLRRFEYIMEAIDDKNRQSEYVYGGLSAVMKVKAISPEVSVKAIANLVSSKPARRCVTSDCAVKHGFETLLSETTQYCASLLKQLYQEGEEMEQSRIKSFALIHSWIYTSSSCFDNGKIWSKAFSELRSMCSEELQYALMTETVLAQKKLREVHEDIGWTPIKGAEFEQLVLEVMQHIHDNKLTNSGVELACASMEPDGGAMLSSEIHDRIIGLVASVLQNDHSRSDMDRIVEAILSAFSSRLGSQVSFREFVSVSTFRAVRNASILPHVLSYITAHEYETLSFLLDTMGNVLLCSMNESEDSELAQLASAVSAVISAFGKHGIGASTFLAKKLLSVAKPAFTSGILHQTPFRLLFGDGIIVSIDVEYLNHTIRNTFVQRVAELESLLKDYFISLDADETQRVGRVTTQFFLSKTDEGSEAVLGCLSQAMTEISPELFTGISEELKRHWSERDPLRSYADDAILSSIPTVVRICSAGSKGHSVESFREFIEETATNSLSDMLRVDSVAALDILASALHGFARAGGESHAKLDVFPWLHDTILKIVEQGCSQLKDSVKSSDERLLKLEGSLSNLLRMAIRCLGSDVLKSRDVAAWVSRISVLFQDVISNCTSDVSPVEAYRLCSLVGLTEILVKSSKLDMLSDGTIDELCHWGAWIGIKLIPFLEEDPEHPDLGNIGVWACSRWCGDLIVTAAETGTLLQENGEMPLPANDVYSLIPYLTSTSVLIRRAVLTAVVHAATMDLSDRVASEFPKDGFADEESEVAFVDAIIPVQLRRALEWSAAYTSQSVSDHDQAVAGEIGYFLAWRVFLDLMRSDDAISSPATLADSGDVSFRRVGLIYLETHLDVYKEFFKRCIEVIVDGSDMERRAAARSSVMALQVEENAASGVIVARSGQAVLTDNEGEGDATCESLRDGNSETAVGHAVGIAFARALQRLPALSRQIVTHDLGRGVASRIEAFVRTNLAPLLIATEVRKVKEWGAQAGGGGDEDGEGELTARGSVAGREVWATYRFSDVTLEIGMRVPDVFPLQTVTVEARSRIGMSEAQWRKTLLGMALLLRAKNGSLAEALALWRRNLDKTFQGADECPICYSVLHVASAALPEKACRTCRNCFHSDCLLRWFSTSNSSACPTCRSVF